MELANENGSLLLLGQEAVSQLTGNHNAAVDK